MGIYSTYIFPKLLDLAMQHKKFNALRAGILKEASGNILEIGIGTGTNLEFYPAHVTRITAIDPNPGMEKYFKAKLQKSRIAVDFFLTGAESMPFPDHSFDTVLSTLTLCSIPNLAQAMREISRVLKPNGKFLFLDHGLSRDSGVAKLQKILNPVQKCIGCGCSLTVDVEKTIRDAGFTMIRCQNFYVENSPKFIGHVYEGMASPRS